MSKVEFVIKREVCFQVRACVLPASEASTAKKRVRRYTMATTVPTTASATTTPPALPSPASATASPGMPTYYAYIRKEFFVRLMR